MRSDKIDEKDPLSFPARPGFLAGFYFSCGPLAGIGFWVGDLHGFVLAIIGNLAFWILLYMRKRIFS